jgi:hypothetical protein
VSRLGEANPGGANMSNNMPVTSLTGCGTTAWVAPPNDVRICNGKLFESVNDGAQVANLDIYPKQPFDFAGRTGKVTFDVSADSDGPHGAWPEFVITDKPVPGVRSAISGMVPSAAANEVGFRLDGCWGYNALATNLTGVALFFSSKNWAYSEPTLHTVGCITRGSSIAMNHIEVRVSTDRIEVWGTDAGATTLKELAYADNLALGFTKGLVWMNDVHYNARKAIEPCICGTQWNHTFVWDNLGFDGPATYRDLGTDVADNTIAGPPSYANDVTVDLGYHVGLGSMSFTVTGVHRDQTPTGAIVVLNSYSSAQVVPSVSVNGNPPIATVWPYDVQTWSWRSVVIPIPVSQVHDGSNTLTFTSTDGSTIVTNVSLILVAGRAVVRSAPAVASARQTRAPPPSCPCDRSVRWRPNGG